MEIRGRSLAAMTDSSSRTTVHWTLPCWARSAIEDEASRRGETPSGVFEELLRRHLAHFVADTIRAESYDETRSTSRGHGR